MWDYVTNIMLLLSSKKKKLTHDNSGLLFMKELIPHFHAHCKYITVSQWHLKSSGVYVIFLGSLPRNVLHKNGMCYNSSSEQIHFFLKYKTVRLHQLGRNQQIRKKLFTKFSKQQQQKT